MVKPQKVPSVTVRGLIWIIYVTISSLQFDVDQSNTTERSGNPGYVVGHPVLAGILEQFETPEGEKYPLRKRVK